ncbi:hsp70-Hsp90 organizing protein 3-like isoform X1 [Vespula squamosa]|uniref:Hsp70-Hsp90 organizing protein 3-like isoform X1 n=1 Tax=Vespula squamosa TaxID=30214 RepID=A0ABD2ABS4_VESSQ
MSNFREAEQVLSMDYQKINLLNFQVQYLKELGNACVKEQKYEEAMFHYTHAIKLDPQNYSLYSNRSFVFLKMKQYHYAMEDALMTIQLKPDWTKGYFRKAEVESQTFRFSEALQSYNKALSLQPNEPGILKAINRTSGMLMKDRRADQQIPWLGAGVGIILGVIVVIADYVFTNKPTLTVRQNVFWHPLLMALLTISIAMLGFCIAKGFRYFVKCQRKSLLEPPIDLYPESNKDEFENFEADKENEKERHPKYSKALARQSKVVAVVVIVVVVVAAATAAASTTAAAAATATTAATAAAVVIIAVIAVVATAAAVVVIMAAVVVVIAISIQLLLLL